MAKNRNKNVGPIIGTFIVVIVVVTAALYVFASHINRQAQNAEEATSTTIIIKEKVRSDDVQTLKNDLNNAIK